MEWISVKDKLPEIGQEVLVIDTNMNYHIANFNPGKTTHYYWDCDEYGLRKQDVNYWIELPKPPKK